MSPPEAPEQPLAAEDEGVRDVVYRFEGNWAADEAMCAEPPWRFTETGYQTAGEVSCTFERIGTVPGGYDIAALCQAQAPAQPYRISLRFAQSADAMLVEGSPSGAIGLIRCPEG
ncbi:MAG: hypothetical protein AB7O04_04395 [Hyphomonadaceae bacterium]